MAESLYAHCFGTREKRLLLQARNCQDLLSEAARLSGVDPTKEKRGAQVLESLVRIYEILRMNALECGKPEADLGFDRLREDAQRKYDQLKDRFPGRFF